MHYPSQRDALFSRFAVGGVVLAAVLFPVAMASAQAPVVKYVPWHKYQGGTFFGFSVSGAGDLDGDLVDDVVVGAPFENVNFSGNVYAFSGADGAQISKISGIARGQLAEFGVAVSGLGDLNGDGLGEILASAPRQDLVIDGDTIENVGFVEVISIADGGSSSQTLYTHVGGEFADTFGISVSGARDVNGDGVNDYVFGTGFEDTNGLAGNGTAYVISGATGETIYRFDGIEDSEGLGRSVAGIGDANRDGYDDVAVGAAGYGANQGRVAVFSGQDGSVLDEVYGTAGQFMGEVVRGVGDVNRDDRDDVFIGLPRENRARVYFGPALGHRTYQAPLSVTEFGFSASGLGDINQDGVADLAIGAPSRSSGAGKVFIYSGDGGRLYTFEGENQGDAFGVSVSVAGDFNGDGFADFVVGASGGGYAQSYVSVAANNTSVTFVEPGSQVAVDAGVIAWTVPLITEGGYFTVFNTKDSNITRGYASEPTFLPADADGVDAQFWDIEFDGQYEGPVELQLTYDETDNAGRPIENYPLRVLHFNGAEWEEPPQVFDFAANTVALTVASLSPFILVHDFAVSLPGDFDGDGSVGGADFLAWQRGESPNALSQADLDAWQTNYGTSPLVPAGGTSVPEPSSWLLLAVAGIGMWLGITSRAAACNAGSWGQEGGGQVLISKLSDGAGSVARSRFSVVGERQNSASPYGTFDQRGNVIEWNEAAIRSSHRGMRGGSLSFDPLLHADIRGEKLTLRESLIVGFGVATVPEPSKALLGA